MYICDRMITPVHFIQKRRVSVKVLQAKLAVVEFFASAETRAHTALIPSGNKNRASHVRRSCRQYAAGNIVQGLLRLSFSFCCTFEIFYAGNCTVFSPESL